MPEHNANADFWGAYAILPQEIKRRADKQFTLLKQNPKHPSLQLKRVGERHGVELWSVRVTLNYRALAIRTADSFLWFWIGDHKGYDSLIG